MRIIYLLINSSVELRSFDCRTGYQKFRLINSLASLRYKSTRLSQSWIRRRLYPSPALIAPRLTVIHLAIHDGTGQIEIVHRCDSPRIRNPGSSKWLWVRRDFGGYGSLPAHQHHKKFSSHEITSTSRKMTNGEVGGNSGRMFSWSSDRSVGSTKNAVVTGIRVPRVYFQGGRYDRAPGG